MCVLCSLLVQQSTSLNTRLRGNRVRRQKPPAAGGVAIEALLIEQDRSMAQHSQLPRPCYLLLLLCMASHAVCLAKPDGHAAAAAARQARASRRLLATKAAATAAGSVANSSTTTAPAASFLWDHFAAPGAEYANLIVVFRTKQLVQRFRPVCSHRERKWAGLVHQEHKHGNTTTAIASAADAEPTDAACATLMGSCRHLYRHAFPGEQVASWMQQLQCIRRTMV